MKKEEAGGVSEVKKKRKRKEIAVYGNYRSYYGYRVIFISSLVSVCCFIQFKQLIPAFDIIYFLYLLSHFLFFLRGFARNLGFHCYYLA